MKYFRNWFPAFAVAALAFGAASTANAQQVAAFSCVGNAGVPPIVRAEGLTELVGDLVLNCTGGTPTVLNGTVPQSNIQIFLNTNVTGRLTSDPLSEALLMIDEPAPGQQRICTGTCGAIGTGALGGVDYKNNSAVSNIYQGRQVGANSLVWLGVPIDPPGTTAVRVLRITNVRANANQLGISNTLIPAQIVMYVSVTGSTAVPINNPQQTVAFVLPGLSFAVKNIKSSYLQCNSFNKDASTDNTKSLASADGWQHILRFREGFASSFKKRASGDPASVYQDTPGAIYNTESGFYSAVTNTSSSSKIGVASAGTRLMARFANVPAGVALYASIYNVASDFSTISSANGQASGYAANLVTTDSAGAGAYSATSATGSDLKAPIALSSGAGYAVWEVTDANPLANQDYYFAIAVSYTAATASNLPGLGTATVAGSFAPLSTVTTASSSAPIPRFADTSSASTLFVVNPCTTNLLFPFLTNQAGFDSGIAISNTSVDPFGTTPQAGPCKLNYYGETTGGGAAPQAQTSATVAAGKQLIAVLSTGGNLGVVATPGFQGYMIAQCSFQYAHGFAFISDVGANRVSEAYLALILDSGIGTRTGFASETLTH